MPSDRFEINLTYKVIIEELAMADATAYAAYMIEEWQAKTEAQKWLDNLEEIIQGLALMPRRFKLIPEQSQFGIEIRQIIYHSHRIVFHINDEKSTVHILRIYHGAREELKLG